MIGGRIIDPDDITDAWRNGWCAHMYGLLEHDNPYDRHASLRSHRQWRDGWWERDNRKDNPSSTGLPYLTEPREYDE